MFAEQLVARLAGKSCVACRNTERGPLVVCIGPGDQSWHPAVFMTSYLRSRSR